jgi:hypothetical protein
MDLKTCEKCGQPLIHKYETSTLVGYHSPEGHDHDDNCVISEYHCSNGHMYGFRRQNKCSTEGCSWVGKTDCFCSPFETVFFAGTMTVQNGVTSIKTING